MLLFLVFLVLSVPRACCLANAQKDSIDSLKNLEALSGLFSQHTDISKPEEQPNPNADVQPADIRQGISALQHLGSLVFGTKPTPLPPTDLNLDLPEKPNPTPSLARVQSKSLSIEKPKLLRDMTPAPLTPQKSTATSSPKKSTGARKPDIFARLEAFQKFGLLAKKITALSEDPNVSKSERIQRIFSDKDVLATVVWVFENAQLVLTPEVLNAIKGFFKSSPIVPDEYRSIAVTVVNALGTLFNPEFAVYFQTAKDTFDRLGGDAGPAFETIWRGVKWVMDTFDMAYIDSMNKKVSFWRRALAPPEMKGYIDMLTAPEMLAKISDSVGRAKGALTAERVHRLNIIFKEYGLFDLDRDGYQTFGNDIGERLKTHLATVEGRAEVESYLRSFNDLVGSNALDEIAAVIQTRASILTPHIAEHIDAAVRHHQDISLRLPVISDIVGAVVEVSALLDDAEMRGSHDMPSRIWKDLSLISDKASLIPTSSLTSAVQFLSVIAWLLAPDQSPSLRILIADLVDRPITSSPAGNFTAVLMQDLFGQLAVTPVLSPDFEIPIGDVGLRLLRSLDDVPALEVERARETVDPVLKSGSFLLDVVAVFQSGDGPASAPAGAGEL